MKLVRFTLVVEAGTSHVDVNPVHVETTIDGTPFQKGLKCTQIRMVSGTSFFVKEEIDDVKNQLLTAANY